MKVSDLKEELKRRSLPVSGAKPQLIERLRGMMPSVDCNSMDSCESVSVCEEPTKASPPPPSPAPSAMDTSEASPPASPQFVTIVSMSQGLMF